MIRKTIKLILSVTLPVILSVGLISSFAAQDSFSPFETCSIDKGSSRFTFQLWSSDFDDAKYTLHIKSFPLNTKQTVMIRDKADALSAFLARLSKSEVKPNRIENLYFSEINERKVQERLMNEASESGAWKKSKPREYAKIVSSLLLSSNAYSEIENVLKKYNLKIGHISVENILTKRHNREVLPYSASVYIWLKK